jgi:hypothetical protein
VYLPQNLFEYFFIAASYTRRHGSTTKAVKCPKGIPNSPKNKKCSNNNNSCDCSAKILLRPFPATSPAIYILAVLKNNSTQYYSQESVDKSHTKKTRIREEEYKHLKQNTIQLEREVENFVDIENNKQALSLFFAGIHKPCE